MPRPLALLCVSTSVYSSFTTYLPIGDRHGRFLVLPQQTLSIATLTVYIV